MENIYRVNVNTINEPFQSTTGKVVGYSVPVIIDRKEFLVVAPTEEDASNKLKSYLDKCPIYSSRNWKPQQFKKLQAGEDLPLERRVEILAELFPVIK